MQLASIHAHIAIYHFIYLCTSKKIGDHLWQGWTICGNHGLPYLVWQTNCGWGPSAAWQVPMADTIGPVYLLLSPVSLLMVIFFGDHMIKSFRYDSNELSSNTVAMTTVILLLYGTMLWWVGCFACQPTKIILLVDWCIILQWNVLPYNPTSQLHIHCYSAAPSPIGNAYSLQYM